MILIQISGFVCKVSPGKNIVWEEVYAYSYVSLYWVPYVNWAIRHALEKKIDCLYFISRDGYHLITNCRCDYKEKKTFYLKRNIYMVQEKLGEFLLKSMQIDDRIFR